MIAFNIGWRVFFCGFDRRIEHYSRHIFSLSHVEANMSGATHYYVQAHMNNVVPNNGRSSQMGYSLIEVIVVLLIIGLMSSTVILAITPQSSAFEKQMSALHQKLNALPRRAVYENVVYGFAPYLDGYALLKFQNNDWRTLESELWMGDIKLQLFIEGDAVEVPDEAVPVVIFEPTGISTSYELVLESSNHDYAYTFSRGADGMVRLVENDQ